MLWTLKDEKDSAEKVNMHSRTDQLEHRAHRPDNQIPRTLSSTQKQKAFNWMGSERMDGVYCVSWQEEWRRVIPPVDDGNSEGRRMKSRR